MDIRSCLRRHFDKAVQSRYKISDCGNLYCYFGGTFNYHRSASAKVLQENMELATMIPTAIIALVGTYYEFTAHSQAAGKASDKLSEKWQSLWVWYIGLNLGAVLRFVHFTVLRCFQGLLFLWDLQSEL